MLQLLVANYFSSPKRTLGFLVVPLALRAALRFLPIRAFRLLLFVSVAIVFEAIISAFTSSYRIHLFAHLIYILKS